MAWTENAVALASSKLKRPLRSASTRTVDALSTVIGTLFDASIPRRAQDLRQCAYR